MLQGAGVRAPVAISVDNVEAPILTGPDGDVVTVLNHAMLGKTNGTLYTAPPSCDAVQDGINCGDGIDILPAGKNPVVSSAAECCALCQQYNSTCTAWTWNQRSNQICYIKSSCVPVTAPGVVSGGAPPLNLPLELNVTLGYSPSSVTSMQLGALPHTIPVLGTVSVKLSTFHLADMIVFKR
jgi:hypothetical protein